ncbi:MAG: hypothetical protein ABIA76_03260 [Candidatus Diapherotrites archaeon]
MLKRIALSLLFCFFALNAFSAAVVLEPVEASLSPESAPLMLGEIMPGQELVLIISDESFQGFSWQNVEITSLPENWSVLSIFKNDKSLEIHLSVPENARLNIYSFSLVLSSPESSETENYFFKARVNTGLIFASTPKPSLEGTSGNETNYALIVSNNSIANQPVLIGSSLPKTWFAGKEIELRHNSVEEIVLPVTPQQVGKRNFYFTVGAEQNHYSKINSVIEVKPTIKGKYFSFIAGFPFHSISLIPFTLADAFFGQFL